MLKLSKPYLPDAAFDLVSQVLKSGNLVQGQYVNQFEQKLAIYLNTEHVILVSSGTAALHLALLGLDIKQGDEIIIPAFSFPAVANAVEMVGATPVFVDIELDNYCIDAQKIESRINRHTKAIIPVHEFGYAADMDAILDIAQQNRIQVIEDAACAIGTTYNGVKAGTFGDLGCFSFHPRKILTTGEGGAIVTNNTMLADKIRKLRNHGMFAQNGKFEFQMAGLNYRMTDFQAALGLSQLDELDETIQIHRKQATLYNHAFSNVSNIALDSTKSHICQTYQTFHIRFDNEMFRDEIKNELWNNNIESNIGAYSIPHQPYYKNKYHFSTNDYLNASKAYKEGLALPVGRHLSDLDVSLIANVVTQMINHGFQ